jgi:hypothetical protein|uniref:Phosphatidic acid phosphatase type 2/haloperoxidase domain-containing protein n=1 Tax=viral metagenome TaxID=1070528 RepID=A0A6C0IBI5_9ZZZZ
MSVPNLKVPADSGATGFMHPINTIKQFIASSIFPYIRHIFQILPEATFVFLILFSILTQNFANGMLAFTMIEALAIFSIIGKGIGYFADTKVPLNIPQKAGVCESGFPTSKASYATLALYKGFLTEGSFPSGSIALLSTLIGYMLGALIQYKNELKQLGPSWEMRIPIAITLSLLTLTAFTLFRFIAGCESLGVIIGTLLIGIVLGTALMFQNMAVFGKESINVLGIPTLESKTVEGKPLYVCAKTE